MIHAKDWQKKIMIYVLIGIFFLTLELLVAVLNYSHGKEEPYSLFEKQKYRFNYGVYVYPTEKTNVYKIAKAEIIKNNSYWILDDYAYYYLISININSDKITFYNNKCRIWPVVHKCVDDTGKDWYVRIPWPSEHKEIWKRFSGT